MSHSSGIYGIPAKISIEKRSVRYETCGYTDAYKSMVRTHLDSTQYTHSTQYIYYSPGILINGQLGDIRKIEGVQRFTRLITNTKNCSDETRQQRLNMTSLEEEESGVT